MDIIKEIEYQVETSCVVWYVYSKKKNQSYFKIIGWGTDDSFLFYRVKNKILILIIYYWSIIQKQ